MISLSNSYVAVLDTCVLAPMPLSDTLLRLATEPALFLPKWSDDILTELKSTLRKFGLTVEQVERRLHAMRLHFPEALVEGYSTLTPMMGNHEKDRHVLAAAVHCHADAIVTRNIKDFPRTALQPYRLDLLTPDEFLLHQVDLDADLVLDKLREQAEDKKRTPMDLALAFQREAPGFSTRILAMLQAQ